MFTGLIEEVGSVKSVNTFGGGIKLTIEAKNILNDIKTGDSININGACQTVVSFDEKSFTVETVEETLKKTNLGFLISGSKVNLESSLTLNKKLGGHFVLGHVDSTGKITSVEKLSSSILVSISYPVKFSNYIINVGAITVNGVSLTIARFNKNAFTVSIIPHTWQETNLQFLKVGDEVNLEFDILGKYVAKILGKEESGITDDWLKNLGYS
ncbi:MAG: riboflavin synthase [Ignavibacteriales bacterium]|nr:MAG: riboflavin synthase [Ignavibacteriales bacterium]